METVGWAQEGRGGVLGVELVRAQLLVVGEELFAKMTKKRESFYLHIYFILEAYYLVVVCFPGLTKYRGLLEHHSCIALS